MGGATNTGGCFTPHITLTNEPHKELATTRLVDAGVRKKTGMIQMCHVHLWFRE